MNNVNVRLAQLADASDSESILRLLEHYYEHPMGAGGPLPADVRGRVLDGLRSHPTTLVFLAEQAGVAQGMAVCFLGYSTFKARPLINIHDLVVHGDCRGQGLGSALIDAVIEHARENSCGAVTLEVRADNPARKLYAKKGFEDLTDPTHGETMLFGKRTLV
ncbi:MAG: GNAT family N-acetyltransferase [Pirellulaceae bacterium]